MYISYNINFVIRICVFFHLIIYSLVWLCPHSFSSLFFCHTHVGEVITHYFVSSVGLSYMSSPTFLFLIEFVSLYTSSLLHCDLIYIVFFNNHGIFICKNSSMVMIIGGINIFREINQLIEITKILSRNI